MRTALHGEAALAEVGICRPSFIVTDWMMPRLDGLELCRRLKSENVTDGKVTGCCYISPCPSDD
ncbi:response regulator [Paraburkholderia xenovorans]|uniref:response regulator n=1 Tax=Paraburkholderia xenovorans TaxID=36873 RepID=UPI0038BA01C1